jgi:Predicted ATPase
VTELLDLIDRKLQRIRDCESFGLWSCSAYFVSNRVEEVVTAASNFRSLMAGDNTSVDDAYINIWRGRQQSAGDELPILIPLRYGMHPIIQLPQAGQYDAQNVKPVALLSGKEIPMFLGLPRSSVPGLVIDYVASFGRDVYSVDKLSGQNENDVSIPLGNIVHMGKTTRNEVELSLEEFRSHCFITGSTGSGKSNTTYQLLDQFIQNGINFLVIEPAKGEYKLAFGGLKGINIFWTNPYRYQLLRINPFRFPSEIHVLEHIDRLIEIFSACWPLYSAMPAILKSAIERSYEVCGWDLIKSVHFNINSDEFPTFTTLKIQLEKVIGESRYSADTKNDYIGALVTRVSSLTTGIMGNVLCGSDDIPDSTLFDSNTIVDLSRVGSSETKSLLMGVMVMRLSEYRMSCGEGTNRKLNHITIIEEAHNLLRRTNTEQSQESANVAGKSVEMISNAIAEMRTYGEGFIIVDQSPTAVDISAIKNTNTKIVMRLPERSDFETVGSTFALKEDQLREISRLGRGRAIVSQSGWIEPIMVQIERFDENLYACKEQPPKDDDAKDMLESWLAEAIKQINDEDFDEDKLRRFTEGKKLRKDTLLRLDRSFRHAIQRIRDNKQNKSTVIKRLLVESIGCIQIAELCIPQEGYAGLTEKTGS